MKRGIVLSLLIGLILLLSVQFGFAKESPHQKDPAGPKAAHAVEAVAKTKAPHSDGDAKPGAAAVDRSAKPKAERVRSQGSKADVQRTKSERPKAVRAPTAAPKGDEGHPDASSEPAATVTPTTVYLHAPHVGASSETFGGKCDGGDLTEGVEWHFVLNGLDHGTKPATLSVTFQEAGARTATGLPVGNGSTQHFYVATPSHDVLLGGSAVVESVGVGKLVLSHVSCTSTCEPEEPKPPCEPEEPKPPCEPEEPENPDTPDKPTVDEPDEEPFLPFTVAQADAVEAVVREAYLPYTGDPGALLMGFATWTAMVGSGFRMKARKPRR
ncbi:MAG TPA: hypothetical protein VLA05_06650 [Coriobacteriia bacterium]|nr:hypothetical protein [Coriobacteriia bacterium]